MVHKKNPFKVKIWTNSHGLGSHHFPKSLTKTFKVNNLIQYPIVDAKEGRILDQNFVDTYKEEFEKIKDSEIPQISVILLGDENIRLFAKKGSFRVVKSASQIVELHKNTKHPLLLCGLVPNPRTMPQSGIVAEYTDDKLQEMIDNLHDDPSGRFFGYVCTTSFFTESPGFIVENKYFSRDGIHLNELGACTLAIHLISNVRLLAQAVIDYAD